MPPQRLPGRRSRKRLDQQQSNRRAPVASRQHDRRRPNSKPNNNFGFVSPKTHQATPSTRDNPACTCPIAGSQRLAYPPEGGADQLLDLWTRTRASWSKSPKKNLSRNPPAERSASGVDALPRSLTIRSFHHRCYQAPGLRAADARISLAILRLLRQFSVLAKTQNSLPIIRSFHVKNLEKRRSKRADASAAGEELCGSLMGPPASAHKSKKGSGVST